MLRLLFVGANKALIMLIFILKHLHYTVIHVTSDINHKLKCTISIKGTAEGIAR